jgi:hypothetical protein
MSVSYEIIKTSKAKRLVITFEPQYKNKLLDLGMKKYRDRYSIEYNKENQERLDNLIKNIKNSPIENKQSESEDFDLEESEVDNEDSNVEPKVVESKIETKVESKVEPKVEPSE